MAKRKMTLVDTQPRRTTINVDGRRISSLEWGPGVVTQPTLVLVHGGNGAAADWSDIALAFAGEFRVLAPDLRGRGYSDWDPAQNYTVAATVTDVESWRATLGLERLVLAGHSFGAVVALAYAANYPTHVERLVLLDGGPVPDRSPADRARRGPTLADIPLDFPSWAAALAWQQARNPAIRHNLHAQLAENHFVRHADGHVTWRSDLAGQVRWSRQADPLMIDQWPFVAALQCPTLVVRGGASPLFGAAIVDRMLATNAHVSAVDIPLAGHSVYHEKPADVITAMRRFLAA